MSPGLSPKLLAGVSRWLAAALLALGLASPAHAVYIQRYSANANGAITVTGNTLGLGCEASCLPNDELRVSLGWNVFGFTDRTRDLTAQDQTQRGVFLRLRFKFDEALF